MSETIYIERGCRFLLLNGKFDVQMWPEQVTASCKLYNLGIPVPAELVGGQLVAEISELEK